MRDIKFRGKMMPENEWIYGTLLRIPHPPVCIGKEEKNDKYYIQFADPRYIPDWNMPYKMVQGEVKPETVGQYTGLKDKNGAEIYEGDIIHIHHKFFEEFNYLLQWNEEYLRYYLYSIDEKNLNSIGGILEAHLGSMINEIEVIGNIYENKNLLKEK